MVERRIHGGRADSGVGDRRGRRTGPGALSWLVGWLWLASLGCTDPVRASIEVVPPEPVPQPVVTTEANDDEDQDGIADEGDQCKGEQEDGLEPDPQDGCKAPPPEDGSSSTDG